MYVAGKTPQAAMNKMVEMALIVRDELICECLGVSKMIADGIFFIVVEGRRHPSYHLVSACAPEALSEFRETMRLLNVLAENTTNETILNAMNVSLEEFFTGFNE